MTNTLSKQGVSRLSENDDIFKMNNEEISMQISERAMGHIINRLTELYRNPIEATVREVVSNAIDATVASGKAERVVEVTMPNALKPTFTVKDNGIGMTSDDIRNVYSLYGASTKANDFTQIGAYGLGAKAPLSYCTQFTVTSVKDGEKTLVIISRRVEGNFVEIVSVTKTNEPSGTTVEIPVRDKDAGSFQSFMGKFLPSTLDVNLIIDGERLNNARLMLIDDAFDTGAVGPDGKPVITNVWYDFGFSQSSTSYSVRSYRDIAFVIGGWVYSAGYYSRDFIAELKPGLVDFSSSRDEITENDRLNALQRAIENKFDDSKFVMMKILEMAIKYDKELPSNVATKFLTGLISYDVEHSEKLRNMDGVIEYCGIRVNLKELKIEGGLNFYNLMKSEVEVSALYGTRRGSVNYYDAVVSAYSFVAIDRNVSLVRVDYDKASEIEETLAHNMSRKHTTLSPIDYLTYSAEVKGNYNSRIGTYYNPSAIVIIKAETESELKQVRLGRRILEDKGFQLTMVVNEKNYKQLMKEKSTYEAFGFTITTASDLYDEIKSNRVKTQKKAKVQSSISVKEIKIEENGWIKEGAWFDIPFSSVIDGTAKVVVRGTEAISFFGVVASYEAVNGKLEPGDTVYLSYEFKTATAAEWKAYSESGNKNLIFLERTEEELSKVSGALREAYTANLAETKYYSDELKDIEKAHIISSMSLPSYYSRIKTEEAGLIISNVNEMIGEVRKSSLDRRRMQYSYGVKTPIKCMIENKEALGAAGEVYCALYELGCLINYESASPVAIVSLAGDMDEESEFFKLIYGKAVKCIKEKIKIIEKALPEYHEQVKTWNETGVWK